MNDIVTKFDFIILGFIEPKNQRDFRINFVVDGNIRKNLIKPIPRPSAGGIKSILKRQLR